MKVLVGIISGFLTAVFVVIGGLAILGTVEAISWGSADPAWSFRFMAGLVEIVGGIILFVSRYAPLGAGGLATMMSGIVVGRLAHGDFPTALAPLILALLLMGVGYVRRPPWLWQRGGRGNL
jgi:hypothetical protein